MAPIPYSANGRMVFSFTVAGLLHKLHYAASIVADVAISGGYALVGNDVGATHIDPANAADRWWSKAKGLYQNNISNPAWTLEQNFGGVFVPVSAGTCAGGFGTGGTNVLTTVLTMTFKDSSNTRANFTFPETSVGAPYRSVLVSDATAVGLLAADMILVNTSLASLGSWVRSRGNRKISFSRYASGTIARRLRRARNFL